MADVTWRSDERGQLLLVAAIGLAVLFVVLALILNTAIYAEAVATQSDGGQSERGAVEYQESVYRGVAGSIASVNAHADESYESLDENLSAHIDEWDELAGRHTAVDGASTSVSLVETTHGTRIVHDENSRYTNQSGATAWTLVESVSNVRDVRMNVTADSLYEAEDGSCTEDDCFYLEVENGSDVWHLFVYRTDDAVRVADPSKEIEPCEAPGEAVEIDITAGTLDGEPCPHLTFAEGVTAPYNVTYVNADRVAGSYELAVDRRHGDLSSPQHYSDDGSPYAEPAIYAATVSITYRSSDLAYTTELRVAPGESDA